MIPRCLLLLILSVPALLPPQATAQSLPGPVARTAAALDVPESAISVWIQHLDAPEPLLTLNADTPRNPASTMKLVTTFAALQALGPQYRWQTEVHALGPVEDGRLKGDLLLRGSGDPWLVEEQYWRLIRDLHRSGLSHIEGDLVFDNSHFLLPPESAADFDGRPDRVYNLLPHPLLVNFNAFRFEFAPAASGVDVRVHPPLYNLQVQNRLGLAPRPCGGYQRGVALHVLDAQGSGQRNQVALEGSFPDSCPGHVMTRTALQPETYAYGLFRELWEQQGGTLTGSWRIGELPPVQRPVPLLPVDADNDAVALPWHVHQSRPLGEQIRLINKYSNNVMTRHLYLTLGAERFGPPATPDKARAAMDETLERFGLDLTTMEMDNAAGLSRNNRLTARQLAELLQTAWQAPFMPEFVSSLALAGLDGTVRRRFEALAEGSVLHLKTGSLDDVSALAGYLQRGDGSRLVFVTLINHPMAHRGPGEEIQQALLRWVLDAT